MQIDFSARAIAQRKVREPLVAMPKAKKEKKEMPDAVKVAIVRAGCFYVGSGEVVRILAPRVQYTEFMEDFSCKEREERITYGGEHTKEVHGEALKQFSEMLKKASDGEILDFLSRGYLEIPRYKWDSENVRKAAVKALVKALGKEAREITQDDFFENGLRRFLRYYRGSPYEALRNAGFEIKPWEMQKTPKGFYRHKKNRIEVTKLLVAVLGKDARELTQDDFLDNGLSRLLSYYRRSHFEALRDAGFDVNAWEMDKTPKGFYKDKANRTAATKWLVAMLGKDAREITEEDFNQNCLGGLIAKYYSGSPYEALLEAGLVTEADEEYMRGRAMRHMREANQSRMNGISSERAEN